MSEKTYRIGEAAALLDLKTYVLRFWETEFPQLEPLRTEKGQRLYTEEHVIMLRAIKTLLYDRGMTIDGARRYLNKNGPDCMASLPFIASSPSASDEYVPNSSDFSPWNISGAASAPAQTESGPHNAGPSSEFQSLEQGTRQKILTELKTMRDILKSVNTAS